MSCNCESCRCKHNWDQPSAEQIQWLKLKQMSPKLASIYLDAYGEHGAKALIGMLEDYLKESLLIPWHELTDTLYEIDAHPHRVLNAKDQINKIRNMPAKTAYDIHMGWAWHNDIQALENSIETYLGEPLVVHWREALNYIEELALCYNPNNETKVPEPKTESKKVKVEEKVKSKTVDDKIMQMQQQIDQLTLAVNKLCDVVLQKNS